jgi:hypothetical protein
MRGGSLAPNRMPVEHSAAEIAPAGKKDPFLYNPRFKATEAGRVRIHMSRRRRNTGADRIRVRLCWLPMNRWTCLLRFRTRSRSISS